VIAVLTSSTSTATLLLNNVRKYIIISEWMNSYLPDADEKTEVLYNREDMFRLALDDFSNVKETAYICGDHNGPSMFVPIEPIWLLFKKLAKRGVRVRFLTEITSENISYCKDIMEYADLRHLDDIKFGGFGLFDRIKYRSSPVSNYKQGPPVMIVSNVKELVEVQAFVFETLWSRAIPVRQRIQEIEEGAKREFVETLREPSEIKSLFFSLTKSAKYEIQLLLSTANSFYRLQNFDLLSLLMQQAANHSLNIKILMVIDDKIDHLIARQNDEIHPKICFQFLQKSITSPNITSLLIDKEYSLVVDTKDDAKERFDDAIGLATYSNNDSTIATQASIFETLWIQGELRNKREQISRP
jgi:two-component system, OmpR family, sensor histidine kinase VicK